ncbi:putative maltokinase [Larkinella sp. C7]|jgi:trehalose synthase-fused probable maltokinase|uniref:putative maltokinase n=1 Tax=Larkinella sp. C7 TaxID=2576607 RepID=UPI0011114875|nr:putative maltokinase [Larkinella sp. C7]
MFDSTATNLSSPYAWNNLIRDQDAIRFLETAILPPYVNSCRWFAGKARQQAGFRIRVVHEIAFLSGNQPDDKAFLFIVEAAYADGETERYLLPLSFVEADHPGASSIAPKGVLTRAKFDQKSGLVVDAIYDERFQQALYHHLAHQQTLDQTNGKLTFHRGKGLAIEDASGLITSRVLPVDSSNSALVFGVPAQGEKYFLKLYRKLFQETNPEVDLVSFLTEKSNFSHIPAYAGSVIWEQEGVPDITLGMMQRMVENQQDSWNQTGDYLNDFLYAVPHRLFTIREDVFDRVELLGRRTGQMHLALYDPDSGDPAFAAEPFTDDYREFIIRRFESLLERRYNLLIDNYTKLDPLAQRLAWVFMEAKEMIDEFVDDFRTRPLDSLRIRIHGDYHLGQVLATGNDFVIIDFEGEPESSISERKIKHSPLKDVAGMIRSYHYAVSAKLFGSTETAGIEPDHLQRVSERWFKLIRDTYMDAYLETVGSPHPLFKNSNEVNFLLLVYLLEKAVYELGYEISYRPAWVKIPLKGIMDVIREIEKIRIADPTRNSELPLLQMGLLQTKKE